MVMAATNENTNLVATTKRSLHENNDLTARNWCVLRNDPCGTLITTSHRYRGQYVQSLMLVLRRSNSIVLGPYFASLLSRLNLNAPAVLLQSNDKGRYVVRHGGIEFYRYVWVMLHGRDCSIERVYHIRRFCTSKEKQIGMHKV